MTTIDESGASCCDAGSGLMIVRLDNEAKAWSGGLLPLPAVLSVTVQPARIMFPVAFATPPSLASVAVLPLIVEPMNVAVPPLNIITPPLVALLPLNSHWLKVAVLESPCSAMTPP